MSKSKSLTFPVNGREVQISLDNFKPDVIVLGPYQSNKICDEKLLLPSNEALSDFKARHKAEHFDCKPGTKFALNKRYDQAVMQEFGCVYRDLVNAQKTALHLRYQAAMQADAEESKLEALTECAKQGHVQAMLELGRLFAMAQDPRAMDSLIEAHNQGHPDGLVLLSAAYFNVLDFEQAVRALLVGSRCGSIRCAGILLRLGQRTQVLDSPGARNALEDANKTTDSLLAKYLLAYSLLHGAEHSRDEARGIVLMRKAEIVRHFLPGKGKGPVEPSHGELGWAEGSLAHLEFLIDKEIGAIQLEKMWSLCNGPRRQPGPSADPFAEVCDILSKANPFTKRMGRRVDAWLNAGRDQPPDKEKLVRMQELLGDNSGEFTNGGNHE